MQNIHLLSGSAYYDQMMNEIEKEANVGSVKSVRVEGHYGNDNGYNSMSSSSSTTFPVMGAAASALVN
tara:strand:+ start:3582 stop:3785 length:204 start_codon:yes stop_codon:yes gene_type:complete